MGFDYRLVNTAGFVSDSTLDNAKERPRYGMVYPTGFTRNEKPIGRAKTFSGELVSSEVVNWLDKKKDNPSSSTSPLPKCIARWPSPKNISICTRNISALMRSSIPDLFYGDWADKPRRGWGILCQYQLYGCTGGKSARQIKAMGRR